MVTCYLFDPWFSYLTSTSFSWYESFFVVTVNGRFATPVWTFLNEQVPASLVWLLQSIPRPSWLGRCPLASSWQCLGNFVTWPHTLNCQGLAVPCIVFPCFHDLGFEVLATKMPRSNFRVPSRAGFASVVEALPELFRSAKLTCYLHLFAIFWEDGKWRMITIYNSNILEPLWSKIWSHEICPWPCHGTTILIETQQLAQPNHGWGCQRSLQQPTWGVQLQKEKDMEHMHMMYILFHGFPWYMFG